MSDQSQGYWARSSGGRDRRRPRHRGVCARSSSSAAFRPVSAGGRKARRPASSRSMSASSFWAPAPSTSPRPCDGRQRQGYSPTWRQLFQVLSVALPTAVYVALIPIIGIYVASALLIALFMIWLGRYGWRLCAADLDRRAAGHLPDLREVVRRRLAERAARKRAGFLRWPRHGRTRGGAGGRA